MHYHGLPRHHKETRKGQCNVLWVHVRAKTFEAHPFHPKDHSDHANHLIPREMTVTSSLFHIKMCNPEKCVCVGANTHGK